VTPIEKLPFRMAAGSNATVARASVRSASRIGFNWNRSSWRITDTFTDVSGVMRCRTPTESEFESTFSCAARLTAL